MFYYLVENYLKNLQVFAFSFYYNFYVLLNVLL